jgi:hypothetical protein
MRLNLAALVVVFGASRTKRVGAPTRTPDYLLGRHALVAHVAHNAAV